jgi:hypothetical protein
MKFRRTRIVFSSLIAGLSLLLIGLWVISAKQQTALVNYRGFRWNEHAQEVQGIQCYVATMHGNVMIDVRLGDDFRQWLELPQTDYDIRGFSLFSNDSEVCLRLPYRFPLLVMVLFAIAPWIYWSTRFGLKTLVLITTAVALVLGVLMYSPEN